METVDRYIFFESDEEFTDFCLEPYAVVVYNEDGFPIGAKGVYSQQYKDAIAKDMRFVLFNAHESAVFRRECVNKRLPIQGSKSQTCLVQLPVKNLFPSPNPQKFYTRLKERISKETED